MYDVHIPTYTCMYAVYLYKNINKQEHNQYHRHRISSSTCFIPYVIYNVYIYIYIQVLYIRCYTYDIHLRNW